MGSRRSESAPASVATETMHPAVIKVTPSLLADLNPLVTKAPLARMTKPTSAMINTRVWWPPRLITFVSLEVWSSQVPTAISRPRRLCRGRRPARGGGRSVSTVSPACAGEVAAAWLPPPGDEGIPEAQVAVPGRCWCDDAEDDRVEDADNGVDADCCGCAADRSIEHRHRSGNPGMCWHVSDEYAGEFIGAGLRCRS